jgi:hypothetical protein
MNTNDKGRIAELLAIAKYISLGYIVLEPVNKDGVYDLVIEKDNKFKKVQVKTLRDKDSFYEMSLRSTSHNRTGNFTKHYCEEDIDLFVGVDILNNRIFQIPIGSCGKTTINLRKTPTKNNFKKLVKYASDFEI